MKNDIEMAKKIFFDEKLSLVIVKNNKVIIKSLERGIKPLYTAIMENGEMLLNASVADKITGKAAAMLCVYGKIDTLYTEVVSEEAMEVLNNSEVEYTYLESTLHIRNRDNTGLCPMEIISSNIDDTEILLGEIQNFLEKNGI
ncbi:protein of unknown function [Anaerosphaera aminiphila DSM 21120]|uniref:DUF1893 domain-containing protein n=1 Tax=Anaerosphaera aminiphila DSM 21120 TaxID=1120995 RepID=A0A1M5Q7F7_9FIRM|nr:DUF1893 domain-containing protein [Anaerosphaera aminiphila]SHH10005.1 protein of unknown function [Anaerosphaera aminiphila DSM 21120]